MPTQVDITLIRKVLLVSLDYDLSQKLLLVFVQKPFDLHVDILLQGEFEVDEIITSLVVEEGIAQS